MKLGDCPKLYDAIMQVLAELDWPMGVSVQGDEATRGYRVSLMTGDRFLWHSRTIIIPPSVANSRDVVHTVRCQVEEMKRDLYRTKP